MKRLLVGAGCAAFAGAAATGGYIGVVTGRLTLDLGIGRRTRPLGPIHLEIAAPRETVFAVAAAPYADRQPRALREKVEILERAGRRSGRAPHPVGFGLTAVTVETVTSTRRTGWVSGRSAALCHTWSRPSPSTRPPTGPGSPTPASSPPTFGGSARPG